MKDVSNSDIRVDNKFPSLELFYQAAQRCKNIPDSTSKAHWVK